MMECGWKRLLSGLLALVLVIGMLPPATVAAEETVTEPAEVLETVPENTEPEETVEETTEVTLPENVQAVQPSLMPCLRWTPSRRRTTMPSRMPTTHTMP